jgi:serine/threonine protein phosphatase PrpC
MTQYVSSIFDIEFQEDGITPEPHRIIISEHIEQMCKKQDQTYTGEAVDEVTGETFKYGMVTDGHGADNCISFLRLIKKEKLAEIVGKRNPVETMANYVNENVFGKFCGGATMCLVKVYKNRLECIHCGDSKIAVFKDGDLAYMSKDHNWENQEERERLLSMNREIYFTPTHNIKVIHEKQLAGVYSEYANWEADKSMLACTQALGSNGKTGYKPHHEIIPILEGSTYKVVIGSDGLWDMFIKEDIEDIKRLWNMTAKEGVDFAVSRWLQEWDMLPLGHTELIKGQKYSRHECDDVSMVSIDISMPLLPLG